MFEILLDLINAKFGGGGGGGGILINAKMMKGKEGSKKARFSQMSPASLLDLAVNQYL